MSITFFPCCLLLAFLLAYPVGVWWLEILSMVFYFAVIMPLITAFEAEEGNLFKFAFGLMN